MTPFAGVSFFSFFFHPFFSLIGLISPYTFYSLKLYASFFERHVSVGEIRRARSEFIIEFERGGRSCPSQRTRGMTHFEPTKLPRKGVWEEEEEEEEECVQSLPR